jgi:hypothetical protein
MRAAFWLMFLLAVLISVPLSVQAQEPPQMNAALAELSTYVGVPVTVSDLDFFQWQADRYLDSGLGCTLVAGTSIPESIVGYTFNLTYQGVTYDIRVSEDQTIVFPCDSRLLEQGAVFDAAAAAAQAQIMPCPTDYAGYLRPRLRAGGEARIDEGGTPNRLRDAPTVNGAQIGTIQPGTVMDVLVGPSCEPGAQIVWWFVRFSGTTGWTAEGQLPAEYFLELFGTLGTLNIPDERSLISTTTVANMIPFTVFDFSGVTDIEIAPEVELIAISNFTGAGMYTFPAFDEVPSTELVADNLTALAVSDDGKFLALGFCSGDLMLIDRETSASLFREGALPSCINSLDFGSGDSAYYLAAGSGTLFGGDGASAGLVLDAASPVGNVLLTFEAEFLIADVAFSPDGTLLAWLDSTYHVVELPTFSEVISVELEAVSPVGAVEFYPVEVPLNEGVLSAYSEGNSVKIVSNQAIFREYVGEIGLFPSDFSFSPDGTLLAVLNIPGEGGIEQPVLTVFDTQTGDILYEIPFLGSAITFSPDGSLLLVGGADGVTIFGVP